MWKKYETPELEIVSYLPEVTVTTVSEFDDGLKDEDIYTPTSDPNTTLDKLFP